MTSENYFSEADLADRDDEDVRFNRRMGIDDNREPGEGWNQPHAMAPEPPAQPQQEQPALEYDLDRDWCPDCMKYLRKCRCWMSYL